MARIVDTGTTTRSAALDRVFEARRTLMFAQQAVADAELALRFARDELDSALCDHPGARHRGRAPGSHRQSFRIAR